MTKKLNLIGVALGIGAGNPGCHEGPLAVYDDPTLFESLPLDINWSAMIESAQDASKLQAMPYIAHACTEVANKVSKATQTNQFFGTIGGDHSCAIGTWSGAAYALREKGDLGLIWVDAHMDSHTNETSETGNIHGMPVAALLGHGDKQLTQILDKYPKLLPQNICLIGIRSFEAKEQALLNELGVQVYYADEVNARGVHSVLAEALKQVTANTVKFGISIDLDGIDPTHAPGVGTPVGDGICGDSLLDALSMIQSHPDFIGFEIAEFNPSLDLEQKTLLLIRNIIAALSLKNADQNFEF